MNYFHDVVILGAGGSGLSLAIKLKNAGIKDVCIISKTAVMGSHTTAAKGGINASLSSISEDKPEWHIFDTLKSANKLADEKRVDFMCKQAPKEIDFLESQGVVFDKTLEGKIDQRRYGGQKTHFGKGDFAFRACFSADSTGFEIMKNLHSSALKLDVKIYEFCFVFDAKNKCLQALDLKTGQFVKFAFKALVLAGGGFSQNYETNSSSNALTGDVHALGMKLGGKLEDIEFIQFHPTGLYRSGILISEAVRAEGGILLNHKGERFMHKYSPDFLELAPRDVVARAIFNEGSGTKPAFLSLKKIPLEVAKKKLKGTLETAKFFAGIDALKQDIPVFPTAHYNMGGLKVDENYKVKEGIFAIGECAGGRIHGANRLGCNSLLELFTSSTLACNTLVLELSSLTKGCFESFENKFSEKKNELSLSDLFSLKAELSQIMQEKCGVLRNELQMNQALVEVMKMHEYIAQSLPLVKSFVFSNEFVLFYELENLIVLSVEVIKSALNRKESRGAHTRTDFPLQSDKFDRFHYRNLP